jgi:hypothetical protein
MAHIYIPIIDNGMGLSRTRWSKCMFDAAIGGAFAGHTISSGHLSYPYPSAACNIVGNAFLKSGADELFLVDTDVIFTPDDIRMLFSHNVPYVGGVLPKRCLGLHIAVFPYEPFAPDPHAEGINPLIDADCGRGFVRIHRSVFELIKDHVPTYTDEQEKNGIGEERFEFFSSKPGGHSEDFAFCELYRKLGGSPVVDQRIVLKHEGSAVYPIPGTY